MLLRRSDGILSDAMLLLSDAMLRANGEILLLNDEMLLLDDAKPLSLLYEMLRVNGETQRREREHATLHVSDVKLCATNDASAAAQKSPTADEA